MHTYLRDPERARAYAHLIEHPYGSLRTWATAIGWTTGKLQRFLARLRREQLGELQPSPDGTYFEPRGGKLEVHRTASMRIDAHRYASAPDLDASGSGLTGSRCGDAPGVKGDGATAAGPDDTGAVLLITALNEEMLRKFGTEYSPIMTNHRGSVRAAQRMAAAGIPLESAIELVRRRARAFTPDKTGGVPYSLGHPYLGKGTIDEWRREERDRQQLPLLPQLGMAVERSTPAPAADVSRVLPREPARTADPAVIGEEFRAIANASSKQRPQRMK